jgi:hypothetical protein
MKKVWQDMIKVGDTKSCKTECQWKNYDLRNRLKSRPQGLISHANYQEF